MATLQTLLSPQMIERLGWTLVHFVWQAAAVALLLAVVLRCFRRSSSNVRYVVSCLAMVLIVALPLVTMSLVEVSRPVAEAGPTLDTAPMSVVPVEVIGVAELPIEPFDAPIPATPTQVVRVPWTQRAANALEPALPWLVSGWLLGVFGLSAWHLGGWAQLQRMKRRMVRQVAEPLHAALADLSNRLGVRRAVGLLESALVEVPTVVGWLKPVILLPASALSGLSTEQLEAIFAHELAHVRRCDYLVNLAQTVIEILGFYHPAVWWVSHRIRDERENCCDDLAVQVCGDSRRYARALTCLEELRHHSTELAVAASGGSLVGRIARLLGHPPIDNRRFAWLPGLIALLIVAAILVPAALVLAAPDTSPAIEVIAPEPNNAEPPRNRTVIEATSPAPTDEGQQRQPKILVAFKFFPDVRPDKVLDRETVRRVAEILAAAIPQAPDEIASKQNPTLGEFLRTWIVGRLLTPETTERLVDVLQSRGYLEGESTPEMLVLNDQQAEMKVVTEEPSPVAAGPATAKPIELGTSVQVTPHVSSPTSDRITLEIGVEWKDRIGEPDPNDNPTFRSTEIASTVTVLRDRYFTLLAEPDGTSNAEGGADEFHLVMFRADLSEPDLTYATMAAAPAPAGKSLSRQVILDIQTVSVEEGSLGDGIVEWSRPQTGGSPWGMRMGYTPDKTFTDALRKHLDELYAQGLARRLAHQRLTTQDGYEARFKAVKEEWFSLTPTQTPNPGAPQAEHSSIASGTIITATPTVGDANNITLKLNTEFSESLPKPESSDLPAVTRRTARNVVTVRDGGTVLLAGLSSPYPDPITEVAILVTAHLAPETEPSIQQDHILPKTPPPSEPPVAPAIAPSASEQATADAAREFIRTDPMVHTLMQRIAQLEVELIEARQKFLPQHPEIVQKKQLLEALNTRLEERRKELEQRPDAGINSASAPDDRAQQRANAEKALAIVRGQVARVNERIDKASSAWYPDEAERSRELADLRRFKEAVEAQLQEISRIVEEQFGPPAEPEPYQLSEPSAPGTVTATFDGTDRREALGAVAEMTGVNIMCDPTVSGEVFGRVTLDDVSIEVALLAILGGSPYVATRTPDGYAVTRRNAQPPTAPSREVDAVAIETRFVLVDPECLEALRRGLPIKGVTAPADANALHALGDDLVAGRTPLLEPDHVQLLLQAVRQYTASKMLATPKVTVLDTESASIRIGEPMNYVSGYREPNDASQEPIPQHASKEICMRLDATPHLIDNQNNIRLQFEMEINSLLGMQKALYRGKYEYDVPTFTAVTVDTEIVIPDGHTALIHVGPIRPFGDILSNESDRPAPMLMLIKPTRTPVRPPDPTPPMPNNSHPGDPGMGGLPPGTNLW